MGCFYNRAHGPRYTALAAPLGRCCHKDCSQTAGWGLPGAQKAAGPVPWKPPADVQELLLPPCRRCRCHGGAAGTGTPAPGAPRGLHVLPPGGFVPRAAAQPGPGQINSPIKSCRSAAGPRGSTTQGAAMASDSASTRSPRAPVSPAVLLRLLLPEHSKAAAVLAQSCRRFGVCDSKHTRLSVREHQFLLPAELSHCTPSGRAVGTESPAPARK